MATWEKETRYYRGVVPATGEVHEVTWVDDHMPTDREVWFDCSCGFSEGPARRLKVGVTGHFEAVGAVERK